MPKTEFKCFGRNCRNCQFLPTLATKFKPNLGCKDHRHGADNKIWGGQRKRLLAEVEAKRIIFKAVRDTNGAVIGMKDTGKRLPWVVGLLRTKPHKHITKKPTGAAAITEART